MRKIGDKGSALILVMVSAIVLSILVAALFTLFQANVRTQSWAKERIQARFTAEAGMRMAVHMIMGGADVPQGDEPIQFLPETGDWEFMGDDLGWVQVWVDPHERNDEISSANAYEVRCLAKVMDEDQEWMYGIASMVLPRNFAVYATFLNKTGAGYYGDGYRFDGPFHANEVVILSSNTAGRNNDIWFYSFSVAADHYNYLIPGTGTVVSAYTPHQANLYIEPYEKMLLGEPYFTLNADTVPFGSDLVGWQGTRSAAQDGGLYLTSSQVPDGTRMILLQDTLLVRTGPSADVDTFDLGILENNVVWINNNVGSTVYLKTEEHSSSRAHGLPDDFPLTIGVMGNLAASGPILYQNIDLTDEDNKGILGLVVVEGDFYIADDPDMWGGPEWPGTLQTWRISTGDNDYPDGIEVDAVIMVLEGYLECEQFTASHLPTPAIDFGIVGGYIIEEEGYTTIANPWSGQTWGYMTLCIYDPRLMTMHPPFFPQTGIWDTAYWDERPDMTDDPNPSNPNSIRYDRI
ncbi:MAG: pilus assembly PilX N-terminal domain-containing protein [Candidatus Fermentibacteraceae bacterium]|nr:pilus assembly PilX N-terminal domain-containing protein [Candidatus Fermentibacteraceae bacterium]MBN2609053.1 pilus assembly PilX N-terminal domain-containing protein [Candidatus Fermentibacteraceae bacterium]